MAALIFGGVSAAHASWFSSLFAKDKDKKEQTSEQAGVTIHEQKRIIIKDKDGNVLMQQDAHGEHNHEHSHEMAERMVGTKADFDVWLVGRPEWERTQIANYERYLSKQLGKQHMPPMHQLLTTARSWQKCGYEPYQVPPSELWDNMLPTLKLYAKLQNLGILPRSTEIRSVYRNVDLNRCAGGAAGSKHLTNGAIDIWVPSYAQGSWQLENLQNRLCQFWIDEGQVHQLGLGIYATGAIHIDTQGYRKWGGQFTSADSPCRYVPAPDPTSIDPKSLPNPSGEILYIDGVNYR